MSFSLIFASSLSLQIGVSEMLPEVAIIGKSIKSKSLRCMPVYAKNAPTLESPLQASSKYGCFLFISTIGFWTDVKAFISCSVGSKYFKASSKDLNITAKGFEERFFLSLNFLTASSSKALHIR